MVSKSIHGLSEKERLGQRNDLSVRLTRYITAACRRKIWHRFNNEYLSLPYFNALIDVDSKDLPSVPLQPFSPERDRDALAKMRSDRRLLEDFVLKMDGNDRTDTKIPTLIKKAKELPRRDDEFFQFYTDDTKDEFHAFLKETIKGFRDSLDVLVNPGATQDDIRLSLSRLYRHGYILYRLSRGSALPMHVNSICDRLETVLVLPTQESSNEDIDTELTFLRRLPLNKMFISWVRVNVSHFDSAESLAKFATSSSFTFNEVHATLLSLERPDNKIPSWRTLFDGETLSGTAPAGGDVATTNTMIRQFLEKSISDATFEYNLLQDTQYLLDSITARNLYRIRTRITSMVKKLNERQNAIAKVIADRSKGTPTKEDDPFFWFTNDGLTDSLFLAVRLSTEFEPRIRKALALSDDALQSVTVWRDTQQAAVSAQSFFLYMDGKDVFTGTVHCEAYLASLLPLHPSSNQPQIAELRAVLQVGPFLVYLFLSFNLFFSLNIAV